MGTAMESHHIDLGDPFREEDPGQIGAADKGPLADLGHTLRDRDAPAWAVIFY